MERAALRPGFRGFKGWWWRLAPQVGADYVGGLCRRGGATALRAEGFGIAASRR